MTSKPYTNFIKFYNANKLMKLHVSVYQHTYENVSIITADLLCFDYDGRLS